MNKFFKSFAFIAAAAVAFVSCQVELQPTQPVLTPGTVVTTGPVHVEFGVMSDEPKTKVTLGTSDDIHFTADWVNGTDKLWIDYLWSAGDNLDGTAVLSDAWNGSSFGASLVGPKDGEENDLPAHWVYTCYYPQPRVESNNHYFAFGANRDQNGATYAGQYDLMYGGAETTNSVAGKDGDEKVVFKMDRLTSIAYFHITTSDFDASEKLATATLEITEADDNIIACDEVYCVNGAIYKYGANQSSSITLNTTQAMDDIKLWYNVIPLTFKKATLTLTTDKGKYIVLKMGDGSSEFGYFAGELYKAKIGTIPASAFTDPTPEPTTYTDVITSADLAATGSSYTPFEGVKKSADNDITSDAVYAGSSSLNGTAVMQFKSKDNNTGIISTTSGGIVSSISVSFNTQNNNTFNVYGRNEAYTSVSELYNEETAGSLVGTLNSNNSTLEFNEDYEYFGIRSSNNAVYVDEITIVWAEDSTPKYTITVDDEIVGGSVIASSALAKEGAEITLLATPASARYEFASWNVTNASTGDPITVKDNKFTMPAAAVNVSATFNKLPYHVSYDKNTSDASFKGTVPTDSKNYTDADNQVTVADGSGLTRDDYTFASWNTKANGEGTSYESGDKFSISDDVTLYAQWTRNTYEVTIETPVNGTLVIKNGETVVNSGDKLQSGITLTVEPTPATGYRFDKWGYKDGDKAWVNNMTSTFTHVMPMAPVQFKVTFEEIPTHLVKFSVNGTIVNGGGEGETLDEGAAITFPADPAAIGDMKFQGWVTSSIDEPTDTKPSFVSKAGQTVGTEDVTYYAVFASVSGTAATWTKTQLANVTAGVYAIISSDGYAFNGTITNQGHGTQTSTAFAFDANGVASSAPEGTCELTLAAVSSGHYTMYSQGKGYLYAKDNTSGNLDWHATETKYWMYYTSNSNKNWEYVCGASKYANLRYSNSTFRTYGNNTGNEILFVKKSGGQTISEYCTTVEIPAQVVRIDISGSLTNTVYTAGQSLNPAGLIVTATYDKGDPKDVTANVSWTYDPATLSAGTTSCTATAHYLTLTDTYDATGLTVNAAVTLQSVRVSGAPTKKEYKAGDKFDPAGLIVTGTYSDSHQETITEGITWSEPAALTAGQTSVTITATVNGITSASFTVTGLTVNAAGPSAGTVLFHETFGDNSDSARNWDNSYSVKSGLASVYSDITGYTVSNAKQGKNTTGSTGSGLNQSSQGTDAYIIVGPLKVDNCANMQVTYQWKAASTKGTYTTKLYYATSSTGSYTEVTGGTGTGATTFVERKYSLPAAAQVSTLYLKVVWNTSNTQAIIDELELKIKD